MQEREGLASWHSAYAFLIQMYPGSGPSGRPVRERVRDWCDLPEGTTSTTSVIGRVAFRFAQRQWGATQEVWDRLRLVACARGKYARRIVFPFHEGARDALITFTTRSVSGAEPKYLAATVGQDSARGVRDVLYGASAVQPGDAVVVVEGPGDRVGWLARRDPRPAVAVCGSSMSPEQVALLLGRRPSRVTVALDTTAVAASARLCAGLRAWGVAADVAVWEGGKDAGAGGRLAPVGSSLRDLAGLRMRLRPREE